MQAIAHVQRLRPTANAEESRYNSNETKEADLRSPTYAAFSIGKLSYQKELHFHLRIFGVRDGVDNRHAQTLKAMTVNQHSSSLQRDGASNDAALECDLVVLRTAHRIASLSGKKVLVSV